LTRAPVTPGRWSRSDGVASGGEELHEVTVAGCSELETPERDHASRWERIRNSHGAWVGCARHPWRPNGKKRENVTQRAPTWRANCRCPDPGVRIPTRKCCVFSRP